MAICLEQKRLPGELWINNILCSLPARTLCQVALVNRDLHKLATDPLLWADKGSSINKRKIVKAGPGLSFLQILRFTKIISIDLSRLVLPVDFAKGLFGHILSDSCTITSINLKDANISSLKDEKELVAQALAKLKDVNLSNICFWDKTSQVTAIFEQVNLTAHHQSFNLNWVNLSQVAIPLFAQSIASLQKVDMGDSKLTLGQLSHLFSFIRNQSTVCLKELLLYNNNMEGLENPSDLVYVVSQLDHVNLGRTRLATQHISAVLQGVPQSNLKMINLCGLDLSQVQEKIISDPLLCLTKVDLCDTDLTTSQSTAVLKLLPQSKTIKEVNLYNNDLSKVEQKLVGDAVIGLRKVNLGLTSLRMPQARYLLESVGRSKTLDAVELFKINLSRVGQEIFCPVIQQVRFLNLSFTSLNKKQCKAIFEHVTVSRTIENINLNGNLQKQGNWTWTKHSALWEQMMC